LDRLLGLRECLLTELLSRVLGKTWVFGLTEMGDSGWLSATNLRLCDVNGLGRAVRIQRDVGPLLPGIGFLTNVDGSCRSPSLVVGCFWEMISVLDLSWRQRSSMLSILEWESLILVSIAWKCLSISEEVGE